MNLITKPLVPKQETFPQFYQRLGMQSVLFEDMLVHVGKTSITIWTPDDDWFLSEVDNAKTRTPSTAADFHNAYRAVTSRINNLLSNDRPVSEPFNVGEGPESEEELNNN